MVRVFTLASGKGGTGKTTVTINLGTSLAQFGKKTCIMDADIGMANLGLSLGLENVPVTLHEVLSGTASIKDAIYEGPGGVQVVPCGISLQGFQQSDPELLKEVLKDLTDSLDYLLIDAPAGISRDGVVPLAVADEVILVVNPELSAIVDAMKTKILAEVVGGQVRGAIINRATPESISTVTQKMEKVLGTRVIGIIPEDQNIRKAASAKVPIVLKYPASDASVSIKKLAAGLAGLTYDQKEMDPKDSFVDRFTKVLFRGRK
ncbi:MAG TPA: cell division ATPase MinD [Methanoregulaceae archaeon]|nr:cell division ATPase MinD [Methanoregulaceae archaeon]HPX72564.1 cell division ATPase MinD [Methanoregulaceae archaeon]HQA79314.1 cell division ATPase MinD [Methanoregulaceae archaeon]